MNSTDIDMARQIPALGASLFAGLATGIGGLIVYFKGLVRLANRSFLSAALGFSSGVMLFLSYFEMFTESSVLFAAHLNSDRLGLLAAGGSLLSGVLLSYLMEFLLHKGGNVELDLTQTSEEQIEKEVHGESDNAVAKRKLTASANLHSEGHIVHNPILSEKKDIELEEIPVTEEKIQPHAGYQVKNITGSTLDLTKPDYFIEDKPDVNLKSVGIMSMIAITIHNFPEGVISYIGYLANPALGISLAIGIAAHNIPEGLSVALPVYYATGSRNKAFAWAMLGGLAEPIGAVICAFLLGGQVNNAAFGFLYGFVAGIMTYICIYELLPTGVSLDCGRNYTCLSYMVGMFFILLTLCLVYVCFLY